jgi:nucleotide-binding universal stress UspA family protein
MKVLFAVDGSAASLDAVGQVAPLVDPARDEVALYCSPPAIGRTAKVTSPEVLARAQQGLVDAVFDEARSRLPEAVKRSAQTITDNADPRHGILAAAESHGVKLVVVGARGLGTLERLLLGSVSRAVVHASKVPVWVSRSLAGRDLGRGVQILIACENPQLGAPLADAIGGLSWPEGSTCRTLTIVPSMFAGQVPDWLQQRARSPDVEEMVQAWAREHDEELRSMRAQMNEFAARLPARCRRPEPIVAEGEPAGVILSTIAREKIDLVVVGAHRKNWLTSALLGSTSEAVLNHAPCSVLVVPLVEQQKK